MGNSDSPSRIIEPHEDSGGLVPSGQDISQEDKIEVVNQDITWRMVAMLLIIFILVHLLLGHLGIHRYLQENGWKITPLNLSTSILVMITIIVLYNRISRSSNRKRIQFLGVFLTITALAGAFALTIPAIMLIANSAGYKVPKPIPIFGKYSSLVDELWDTYIKNDIKEIIGDGDFVPLNLKMKSAMISWPIIGRFISRTEELDRFQKIEKILRKCKLKFWLQSIRSFLIVAIPILVIDEIFPTWFGIGRAPPSLWINLIIGNILLLEFALSIHRTSAADSGVLKMVS